MPYIDFHCDTLLLFSQGVTEETSLYENQKSVDFKRMREGGCRAQFFATFMPPQNHMRGLDDETFRQNLYAGFTRSIQEHSDIIGFAKTYEDYAQNLREGKMSAFLTFEDGRMVDGSFEKLQAYHALGYRLITLTWNYANCFGYPNSTDKEQMALGLTPFGREAIQQMNALGILVDVSHLSDGGFYDVAQISSKPFIASHSCCRALTDHPRNLTDDMIRILGEKGGLCGINYEVSFNRLDPSDEVSRVTSICDHLEHLAKHGGMELVALGSDWDGISPNLEIASPLDLEKLFAELARRGWTESQIDGLAYKNAERVLQEVLI